MNQDYNLFLKVMYYPETDEVVLSANTEALENLQSLLQDLINTQPAREALPSGQKYGST